jgi:hypothetical protein
MQPIHSVQIYMIPPNIVVLPYASVYSISLPVGQRDLFFGYVQDVNFNTTICQTGDRILYPVPHPNPVIIINDVQYSIIDERTILLREPDQFLP